MHGCDASPSQSPLFCVEGYNYPTPTHPAAIYQVSQTVSWKVHILFNVTLTIDFESKALWLPSSYACVFSTIPDRHVINYQDVVVSSTFDAQSSRTLPYCNTLALDGWLPKTRVPGRRFPSNKGLCCHVAFDLYGSKLLSGNSSKWETYLCNYKMKQSVVAMWRKPNGASTNCYSIF